MALACMRYMEQASLKSRVSTAHAWITRGHHLFGHMVDSGTRELGLSAKNIFYGTFMERNSPLG